MTKYQSTTIKNEGSFGMYQPAEYNGDTYEDLNELLAEIKSNTDEMYILGQDKIPDEVEDIRGNIYNEPDYVLAVYDCDEWRYVGIREVEETL